MGLKKKLMQPLIRPRVVHSLPGRLRIHLPFISRIDPARSDLVQMVSRLTAAPEEIYSADVSPASGNVLILYDKRKLSDNEVLKYLQGLLEIFLENRERFQALPPHKLSVTTERMLAIVKGALGRRLVLDTEVEIPDDVFA